MESSSNRYPWALLEHSPPPCDNTISPFGLDFTNDTSACFQQNQEGTNAWIGFCGTPGPAFLGIDSFNDIDLNYNLLSSLRDGPYNALHAEDANFYPFVESPAVFPHSNFSAFPENSGAESQVPSPWDPFSSQSPYPGSLDVFPGSPGLMFTSAALTASPAVSDFMTEEFLSSTEVVIPGLVPYEPTTYHLPQVPERRPNNRCHGQRTQPLNCNARERRRHLRPVKCPVCDRGHQYKSDMYKHIRTRHREYAKMHGIAEDPFICDMCGKSYTRSDRLYRHKVQKHEWPPRKKRC